MTMVVIWDGGTASRRGGLGGIVLVFRAWRMVGDQAQPGIEIGAAAPIFIRLWLWLPTESR